MVQKNPTPSSQVSTPSRTQIRGFDCSGCKQHYEFNKRQIKSHRRNCTNRIAHVFYPRPNLAQEITLYCECRRQDTDNKFRCLRCPKTFVTDNAFQKHSKICLYSGPCQDDPVSIYINKHTPNNEQIGAGSSSAQIPTQISQTPFNEYDPMKTRKELPREVCTDPPRPTPPSIAVAARLTTPRDSTLAIRDLTGGSGSRHVVTPHQNKRTLVGTGSSSGSSRYSPYPSTQAGKRKASFTAFPVSDNRHNPPPTPIIGDSWTTPFNDGPSRTLVPPQSPLLHRSLAPDQLELQSPFPMEMAFPNPARRLDFTPQSSHAGPSQPSTTASAGDMGESLFTSPPLVAGGTSVPRSQLSVAVSNIHNPPLTPIPNMQPGIHAQIPVPQLDDQLQVLLDGALRALTKKCPLCYYQGLPHEHLFSACPINATARLGNLNDTEWEQWKGHIFVSQRGTHCFSCFIPLTYIVHIPHKRPVKFHKGFRGHVGCHYKDTIMPMVYLAWRLGNMPALLSRYSGVDHQSITANLGSFSNWLVTLGGPIPPTLLILLTIIEIRGPP
ncbi:hypothetical protein Agabi119p4_10369 [Agaricus bisporus var. burnettii]|uniref:C2H2-type domain-containing protein n=1 Tax=Agaricus bisporus var. burnettii TaxID=192524 RepID=A0A8H7EWW5_AGABI|nr:hypothetical protein Agabi119p4_10369 [Agaricus bisporus var. burnettii]